MNNYPILAPQNTWFAPNDTTITRAIITEIELVDSYTPDASVTIRDSWDASAAKDGSITCYVIDTKVIIAGNGSGKIAANENSNNCFGGYNNAHRFKKMNSFIGSNLLDTSNVTSMDSMFCYSSPDLTILDLSTWDVSKVTNMHQFFALSYFTTIIGLSNWDVSKVTNMSLMFASCFKLISLGDLSNWDISSVTNISGLFYNCPELTSVGDISNWDVSNVTSIEMMFSNCGKLSSLDLSKWNVSKATSMYGMFDSCKTITTLGNLSNWNISNVTNAYSMFSKCDSLTTIGDISNWDVSSITNMCYMFGNSPKLTNIGNLANWNTSNVTDMSFMFYSCSSLKEIDVSKWNVSKVQNFDHFAAHANLKRKGIENWKITSATNLNALFHNCAEEELDLSGWDTSKVQFFTQMFENSPNLKHIKGLDKWDTSNAVGFDEMFGRCYKLEELDLSSWNTSKAKNGVKASINGHTTGTFRNFCNDCHNLKWIKLGPNFAVNGDGTNTNAEYKLILPVPAVEGADGLWRTFTNKTFEPNAIPDRTANTYYASKNLIRDLPVRVDNGSLLDIVAAVRERVPNLAPTLLSDIGDVIRNIEHKEE